MKAITKKVIEEWANKGADNLDIELWQASDGELINCTELLTMMMLQIDDSISETNTLLAAILSELRGQKT
jgi:hypothetical protein